MNIVSLLAKFKGYAIGFGIAFVLISGFIIWHNHAINSLVEDTKNERNAWWTNHIANSPVQRDTQWLPSPKQKIKIKVRDNEAERAIADSAFEVGWTQGHDALLDRFEYVAQKVDTSIVFPRGDTVTVNYDPPSHILIVGLQPIPQREITNTRLISIPPPEIKWYNSNAAWYAYGVATVLVGIEAYHLATK